MNPFFSSELAQLHIGELRRAARVRRVSDEFRELEGEDHCVTVRASRPEDREAVRLLAALDGKQLPGGPLLVAEVDDEVRAALPLDGGAPLADPFRRTAHLVAILELRARQLARRAEPPRRFRIVRLLRPSPLQR